MDEIPINQDILDLYTDLSASFLALVNALELAGVVTKAQISAAAQERLLAMHPTGVPNDIVSSPLLLLRTLAVDLMQSDLQ